MSCRSFCRLLVAAVFAVTPALAVAAESRSGRPAAAEEALSVDLFDAIQAEQVEVRFIPRNAKQATVLFKNKTKRPLSIRLPEAFAGVPVLAQLGVGGGRGGGGLGGGGFGGGGGNQGMGGGFGGGMGGGMMGGGGQGGGFFNVAPEKERKLKVALVCLEHGKKDPKPSIPYEIRPIDSFTKNTDVIELCKMLGRGEIDQTSAQAAAWHLTDGLSWETLARKEKIRLLNGYVEYYFNRRHIARAAKIVQVAGERAKQNKVKSPGQTQQALVSPGEKAAKAR